MTYVGDEGLLPAFLIFRHWTKVTDYMHVPSDLPLGK